MKINLCDKKIIEFDNVHDFNGRLKSILFV